MKTANPFVPTISLMAVPRRNGRNQFKIGIFAVVSAHLVLLMGLLIQGCKSDVSRSGSAGKKTEALAQAPADGPSAAGQKPVAVAAPLSEMANTMWSNGTPTRVTKPALAAVVPAAPAPAPEKPNCPPSFYVVKSGDTLSSIARAHGTSAKAIKSANNLSNQRLAVGQKLVLPSGGGLAAQSSPQTKG
jgi:LysM repeat protein